MDINNLNDLYDAMRSGNSSVCDARGQWRADLPNFGGDDLAGRDGVWSWDATRVIAGTCADDLTIEPRVEKSMFADESIFEGQIEFNAPDGRYRAEEEGAGVVGVYEKKNDAFIRCATVNAKFTPRAVWNAVRDIDDCG